MRRLETLPTFPILIYPYPPIPYYIGRGVETHTEHHRHWASGNIYVVHALGRPLYFLTPHSSLCYVHHSVGLPPSNPKHLKRTTSNYLYSIMSLFQATYSAYPPTPPPPLPSSPPLALSRAPPGCIRCDIPILKYTMWQTCIECSVPYTEKSFVMQPTARLSPSTTHSKYIYNTFICGCYYARPACNIQINMQCIENCLESPSQTILWTGFMQYAPMCSFLMPPI